MSWTPISNTPPQYEENGIAASGYYIKFYVAGTTTPTAMATDFTGGTLLDKCQLNSEGYPINGSSAVFLPHIDKKYKIALFRNEADADSNNLANAAWPVDNLFPFFTDANTGTDFDQIPLNTDIVYPVANVTALRALTGITIGQQFYLAGHTNQILGAGPVFATKVHTSEIDNNGDLFVIDGVVIERPAREYVTPEEFGALKDGSTEDTVAFQAALDAFPLVVVSPGVYMISRLIPNDNNTIATLSLSHGTSGAETSTILRYITGSLSAGDSLIDCVGKVRVNLMGFMLDGVDSASGVYGINPTDLSMLLFGLQITEFERGLASGTNYISTSDVIGCKFTRCGTAIRGGKDTRWTNVHTIGCTDFGFNMGSGSNDNHFTACKSDFNGVNMNIFDGSNNVISGCNFDRASTVGLRISGGQGNTVGTCDFRRNGRDGNTDDAENCHIKIEGGAVDVMVTGCVTRIGADDGGAGNIGARVSMYLGTCTNVRVVSSDLDGFTNQAVATAGTQTNVKFGLNSPEDVNDVIIQKGMVYAKGIQTGSIAATGGVGVYPIQNIPINTFSRTGRLLRITGRTSTGADYMASVPFMIERESGSATSIIGNIVNEINTVIGASILVGVINVAADGSSFDVEVTNNLSSDIKAEIIIN